MRLIKKTVGTKKVHMRSVFLYCCLKITHLSEQAKMWNTMEQLSHTLNQSTLG